jgi:hypothetical protein
MSKRGDLNREREKHPSYAMVGISRQTSTGTDLFGSDIKHHELICFTIREADKVRDLNRDWYHGGKTITEITMSPAQFAEMITTLNVGFGVPCTLNVREGVPVEEIPVQNTLEDDIEHDIKESMQELSDRLHKLSEAAKVLEEKGPVKAADKKAAIAALNSVIQEVQSNIPWIEETTKESCEKTVSRAKAEVDAMAVRVINTLGKKAIEEAKEEERKELESGDGI